MIAPVVTRPAPTHKLRRVLITEVREWQRLYEHEDMSLQRIATRSGRALSTVRRELMAAGVTMRPPSLPIHKPPHALTAEQIAQTVAVYAEGLSTRQVGLRLVITESAVRNRLAQAGIPIRSPSEALCLSELVQRMPQAREAQIVAMWDAGALMSEVVAAIGYPRSTVRVVLRRNARGVRDRAIGYRRARELRDGAPRMAAPDPDTLPRLPPRRPGMPRTQPVSVERCQTAPSAPLASLLDRLVTDDRTIEDVCESVGLASRTFRAWRDGERPGARLDVADRILTRTDRLWWEVYDPQLRAGVFADRQRDDVLAWLDAVDRAARLWEGEGVFAS